MIIDNIVIELPHIEEKYVLVILAVIQAYEKNAYDKHKAFYRQRVGGSDLVLNTILVRDLKYAAYDFLWEKCLKHLRAIMPTNSQTMDYLKAADLALTSHTVLSYDVAANIARSSKKHLSQAFGIMLGSENDSLPDVSALIPESYVNNSNVLEGNLITVESAHKVDTALSLEERAQQAVTFTGYLGEINFESYFVSCLKKPVFEISFGEDIYLLSKWSNPNYFHSSSTDKAAIDKGIDLCLNRILVLGK